MRGGREFLLAPMASLRAWAAARSLSLGRAQELALEAGIFPEALERNFPTLTPAEQLTLWRGSALVAGLGGLGGCQAMLLARAGVGRLYLADGDAFTPSNLNRQLLATALTLGQNKAVVTARHLRRSTRASSLRPSRNFWIRSACGRSCPRCGCCWTPWIPLGPGGT